MNCLRTEVKIGSSEWRRKPACNCKNCIDFFNRCAEVGDISKVYEEYEKK